MNFNIYVLESAMVQLLSDCNFLFEGWFKLEMAS